MVGRIVKYLRTSRLGAWLPKPRGQMFAFTTGPTYAWAMNSSSVSLKRLSE
jgi:hypothetical protein